MLKKCSSCAFTLPLCIMVRWRSYIKMYTYFSISYLPKDQYLLNIDQSSCPYLGLQFIGLDGDIQHAFDKEGGLGKEHLMKFQSLMLALPLALFFSLMQAPKYIHYYYTKSTCSVLIYKIFSLHLQLLFAAHQTLGIS